MSSWALGLMSKGVSGILISAQEKYLGKGGEGGGGGNGWLILQKCQTTARQRKKII